MDEILENAIIFLIRNERFYAEMLHRMKKRFTTDVNTLGVYIDTQGVNLKINPYFFKDFSVAEQAELLKHECEHPYRGLVFGSEREKSLCPEIYANKDSKSIQEQCENVSLNYLVNIAEDCAINETLPKLPKTFKYFDKEGNIQLNPETNEPIINISACVDSLKEMFPEEKIERNQATEYYFSFLKQMKEENKFNGKDKNGHMILTLDDHNSLGESLENINPEFAKEIMNKLVQEAREATPGRIPGHIEILIDKFNKKTKDWRQDLQMFDAMCQNTEEECTNRRRNRRYGLLYPGKRVKVKSHLVAAIDDSGSVNDKQLTQVISELTSIHANDVDITVIFCDTAITSVFRFDPNQKIVAKGRGGTAFSPVFNLIQTKEFIKEYGEIDGLIYLTDGGNWEGDELKKPQFPVLWALLPHCKSNYEWGEKCWITCDD